MTNKNKQESRRQFLKATGLAAAGTVLATGVVHAAGSDTIKVGVIGCGGRGSGAAENVLSAAKGVEVVAVGDYFKDRAKGLAGRLANFVKESPLGNKVHIPEQNVHGGLSAFEGVINTPGVNYIILATSPGFRPLHLQAAISAGKNVFTEKPVAVDGTGIRMVLAAYEEALKKKLAIGAGTQRRHQTSYRATMKRIHDGAIGDIVAARAYWNGGNIWFHPRKSGQSDLDYQIYNWYHFLWLCGDHITEQHVHNLDVINWATGKHPLRCLGFGGRVRPYRDPNVDGNIYNFFAIDYEYPDGVHLLSTCRQIDGCENSTQPSRISGISEALVGTKGTCMTADRRDAQITGATPWTFSARKDNAPYTQEHTDLIASIRKGEPYNELKNVAQSTLTAIMGRMAAYTGKAVTWEQALNSKLDTMPKGLSRDMKLETAALPVPGKTRLT